MKKPKGPQSPAALVGPLGKDGGEGANNHWASGFCQMKTGNVKRTKGVPINIGAYNCRTLLHEDRLLEFEEELKKIKWSVIGLSEVRRQGEEITDLESGHIFYHNSPMDKRS